MGEEINAFRAEILPENIETINNDFIQFIIARTPYTRTGCRLTFPENYPSEPLLLELKSRILGPKLLKKAEIKGSEEAARLAAQGEGQIMGVVSTLRAFLEGNRFIPCWKEMVQLHTLVQVNQGKLQTNEETGQLKIKMTPGKYKLTINAQVPEMYPEEGISVELGPNNFPEKIAHGSLAQTHEVVRRCVAGYSPDAALSQSNPIQVPLKGSGKKEPRVRLTSNHLRNLKSDVAVLKKTTDLRNVDQQRNQRTKELTHSTQERRSARRELRNLAKDELQKDQHQEEKARQQELREAQALLRAKPSDISQPSLFTALRFLIELLAVRLPTEPCQSCSELVLPEDPASPEVTQSRHPKRPIRVFCGHWFHHHCLDVWMTQPPFGKDCPVCCRKIYHPEWPADPKILERAWANKQARQREIDEVSEFMAVGAKFQNNVDLDDII